jgi:hypothetical protein
MGVSWAWMILPQLEQENIYNLLDLTKPMSEDQFRVLNTAVPIYFCPSRRPPRSRPVDYFSQASADCIFHDGVRGVPGDYAASIGTTGADYALDTIFGPIPQNGAFRWFVGGSSPQELQPILAQPPRGIQFASIVDGLSNTFLVGEKHVPTNQLYKYPLDCGIYDGHQAVCNTRSAGPGFPLANSRIDPGWKFGSYHPGICQFVFCDGSVRSIRNTTGEVILGLLAQRNDRQPIPDY